MINNGLLIAFLKKIFFPGPDIALRQRMKFAKNFKNGDILTLDAGCGNGAFSFEAYKKGNQIIGIDFDAEKLKRCEKYRDYLKIDQQRCRFKIFNIYELSKLNELFDQIICFETLEHLKNDNEVVSLFAKILKSDGFLHLCVPNADRKPYYGEIISIKEDGGHLRLGYTSMKLEKMLNKEGFTVLKKDNAVGFFGKKLVNINQWISLSPITKNLPARIKDAINILILVISYPITLLDIIFPSKPLNIYLLAQKNK